MDAQQVLAYFYPLADEFGARSPPPKNRQLSSDWEKGSVCPGVNEGLGEVAALGKSVPDAVECHSHFLVSCTGNFKLGIIATARII